MKHTKKKKLLAFVLCMVLVLSTAITAFAVDGNFYYVPKDTVELSHEIMKDGASQGTLYATVPGGAFKSSSDNAELQMDMQEETSESTVLEAVQTELENTGSQQHSGHKHCKHHCHNFSYRSSLPHSPFLLLFLVLPSILTGFLSVFHPK